MPNPMKRGDWNRSNLTPEDIRFIRRARSDYQGSYGRKIKVRVLALRFKISPSTISRIANRVFWKHVKD